MPTSFELMLDDTSPVINYYPFAETLGAPNLLAGWNSYFSQSGFLSQLGETGEGDSLHVTSLDGAVFTIQWFGSGITLFGSVVDGTYQVSLDGASPSLGTPRQDILAEFQGLQSKEHLIALIAHPNAAASNASSYLAFDRAALNISTDLVGASVSSEVVNATSPRWLFSGDWELSDTDITSHFPEPYRVSNIQSSTASIAFTGSAISLTGIRNITNGHYNVTLDGATTMFDGHSDWLETSTLFLQAGLDETMQHTLTVTNADDATLAITGLNITHVSGGTPQEASGPAMSTGTVIGVVLAIILGVLAAVTAALFWYFRFRRRHDRRPSFTNGAISSENSFRDLDSRWPSIRKNRPSHISKNSEVSLQNMYVAAPQTGNDAEGGERDRDGDRMESPVVLIANKIDANIDPASPTPYLRSSKISSFVPNSPVRVGRERLQWERAMSSGVESVVDGPFTNYTRPESGIVDPSRPPRSSAHWRDSPTATSSLLPLRVQIPRIPPLNLSSQPLTGTPTSCGVRRGSFLQSPSQGTSETLSRLPSASTIHFADHRRGSASTSAKIMMTEDVAPASSPPQKDMPFDMGLLPGRRAQRERPKPGLSNWKPPW